MYILYIRRVIARGNWLFDMRFLCTSLFIFSYIRTKGEGRGFIFLDNKQETIAVCHTQTATVVACCIVVCCLWLYNVYCTHVILNHNPIELWRSSIIRAKNSMTVKPYDIVSWSCQLLCLYNVCVYLLLILFWLLFSHTQGAS